MADQKKALSENVEGNYFVDSSCINCGVSRHYAPEIFGDAGRHAFVKKQPQNEKEAFAAKQALLACPTASIGTRQKENLVPARHSFPMPLAKNIHINGFNHRNSYGAHSYFILANTGNWLIDSPRFTSNLVKKFEAMGGLRYIFLTHGDDVGDAHRYAHHFGAKRMIHLLDSEAQKDAEIILEGEKAHRIGSGEIYFTPGHTRGHIVLLWNTKYLFTGDHFAWISSIDQFGSFRNSCWYSWKKQIESVRKMQEFKEVEWVFPGHGKWGKVENGQFPEIIKAAVQRMYSVK